MILSKDLKAKLSSITSGVTSLSMLGREMAGKLLGLRSTTRRGDAPAHAGLVGVSSQ